MVFYTVIQNRAMTMLCSSVQTLTIAGSVVDGEISATSA